MNFPIGNVKVQSKSVKQWDARAELENLSQQNFSGYVIETLYSSVGVDECALLFRSGQVIASAYEVHFSNQSLMGDESLAQVGNAFAAEYGVIDVSELSSQQVDLIVAFNQKLQLSKPLQKQQLRGLVKENYDSNLLQKSGNVSLPRVETKESLFKKFGLAGIESR